MSDGNPPSSWYDPPEPKYELEIKREELAGADETCDKCEEVAYMTVEVGDVRYSGGSPVTVCKGHYETIIKDTIEEIENYEPDYEED
jgi:hypothetical protein